MDSKAISRVNSQGQYEPCCYLQHEYSDGARSDPRPVYGLRFKDTVQVYQLLPGQGRTVPSSVWIETRGEVEELSQTECEQWSDYR